MKKFLTFLLLSFTFFMSVNSVYAQRATGEISGVVKDQSTQEILPYAVVNVKGTSLYSVTDPDGVFRITGINAGEITLEITFVGYATQTVEVSLNAGERKTVEIMLSDAYTAIGEVVVSAQRLGQNAAINQRLNSDALVNVVSKDAIRELPDINAAEAIGRLPGVSLTRSGGEGSKVILRGLDPKFASVSINGIKQPATDLDTRADRSVDLSNISPEMLSGIEIFKSPTADMDADAIAGAVNLVISKAPDLPKNQIRLYGGYNGLSESFGDVKGSWDISRRFMDKKLGMMAQANYDKKDRSAHGVNRSYWVPDVTDPEVFYIDQVTLINREQTTKRYGVSAFVDYQFKNAGLYLNNIFNASPRTTYTQEEEYVRSNQRINHNLRLSEDNTYSVNTSLGGNFKLPVMKIDWNLTRVQTRVNNPYDMNMAFISNALDPNINWNEVSDPKVFTDNTIFKGGKRDLQSTLDGFSFNPDTIKQVNYIAKIDFEVPVKISDKIAGFIKVGGKYQTEDRKRSGRAIRDWPVSLGSVQRQITLDDDPRTLKLNSNRDILMTNFYNPKGADLFDGYSMYAYTPASELRYWKDQHFFVGDPGIAEMCDNLQDRHNRYYEATERTGAAYIMLKLNYGNLITLVPGLRYEHSNNDYVGIFTTVANFPVITGYEELRKSNQTYGELLPSIHLKVKPTEWMDVRLSTVKTLSRPNYMWVLPRLQYNATGYTVSRSNPDLKHATSWNYDASITVYTGEFGLMSFGGYLKKINNMFYQTRGTLDALESVALGLPRISFGLNENYINLDDSYVKGLEFEYNTHFNFLPSPFNRFLLGFNVTRLWSGTYYLVWNKVGGIQMDRERPYWGIDWEESHYDKQEDRMPTQVDWTSNAWLGYDFKGFSARVSLAYQGTRLNSINTQYTSNAYNTYTASTTRIDFTAKQKINQTISILLNLNNLTNATDGAYRWQSQFPTSKTMYGFTGELGIQINL